jgi:rRNA maturation endonuclease Nob1
MAGKKYCRRCEYYFVTEKKFCQCCGMQLRLTPSERDYKEKIRENQITITKK